MAKKKQRSKAPTHGYRPDRGPRLEEHDLFLRVSGFKAIGEETEVRVAPLTIISGANSSGKSSFMQPFLLLKQTLESSFDPGPLLLHGPNAKFTQQSQTLSRRKSKATQSNSFSIRLASGEYSRSLTYKANQDGFDIDEDVARKGDQAIVMRESLSKAELSDFQKVVSDYGRSFLSQIEKAGASKSPVAFEFFVERRRCFLELEVGVRIDGDTPVRIGRDFVDSHTAVWSRAIRGLIHIPGLRGNPEREYPRSAVGSTYIGTLETYVASIILEWATSHPEKLDHLAKDLERLGLTWKVTARKVNDAAVEVLVGRLPHAQQGGAQDMVSVADVGFGVSQTLPVLVGLLAAQSGQIVYLEQPEIHLHPRAQLQLAKCLVEAANRGVKVITETHSSLLIRAVQTEIAEGAIRPGDVSMNWFSRDEKTGFSRVEVADLDDEGRFGDWPIDFDEIMEEADSAYLAAIRASR